MVGGGWVDNTVNIVFCFGPRLELCWWWGGFQVSTVSNPTKLLLQLLWVELSYVGFWQLLFVLQTNLDIPEVIDPDAGYVDQGYLEESVHDEESFVDEIKVKETSDELVGEEAKL